MEKARVSVVTQPFRSPTPVWYRPSHRKVEYWAVFSHPRHLTLLTCDTWHLWHVLMWTAGVRSYRVWHYPIYRHNPIGTILSGMALSHRDRPIVHTVVHGTTSSFSFVWCPVPIILFYLFNYVAEAAVNFRMSEALARKFFFFLSQNIT